MRIDDDFRRISRRHDGDERVGTGSAATGSLMRRRIFHSAVRPPSPYANIKCYVIIARGLIMNQRVTQIAEEGRGGE